jgi:uncharacterized protein (TIGR01777 family)
MDFLVTGATGFIGRKVVRRLLSEGNEVNYLGRKRSATLDSRAAFHLWNPAERPPLDSVPTLDAVIHLAGEPIAQRWNEDVKRRIRESRAGLTRSLVAAIGELKHRPRVLVSASAVGYYGDRGEEVLSENSAPGSGFLADVCSEWESEALKARELGIRVVVVRIATVLGREGGALKQMLTPFRLGLGGRFGSGEQWMPWIHVDDLVALLIHAATNNNVGGAMNASSPNPVRNREFVRALGAALHRPTLFPVPRFALRVVLGEVADFVFESERVMPEATLRSGFEFRYPDLQSAFRSLLRQQ